jgi:hypothetical protein
LEAGTSVVVVVATTVLVVVGAELDIEWLVISIERVKTIEAMALGIRSDVRGFHRPNGCTSAGGGLAGSGLSDEASLDEFNSSRSGCRAGEVESNSDFLVSQGFGL